MTKRSLISAFVLLCSLGAALAAAQKTGTLKGKVEDEKNKPVAGALVRVMSSRTRLVKEATTDSSGNYSFELEPDSYTVTFDAEGFDGGTLRQMQQVEEGKQVTVKTTQLTKAKRTSRISGAVFDSNGMSLPGARVKLARIPTEEEKNEGKKIKSFTRDYTTNSRGEYSFRVPSMRARYQLTATASGFKPEIKTVDVNENEGVPLAFSLQPVKE